MGPDQPKHSMWVSTRDQLPPVASHGYTSRTVLFQTRFGIDFARLEYDHPPEIREAFACSQRHRLAGQPVPDDVKAAIMAVDLDNPRDLVPDRWARNVGVREGGSPYFALDEVFAWLPIPSTPELPPEPEEEEEDPC